MADAGRTAVADQEIGGLLDRGLMPVPDGEPERVSSCFVHGHKRLPARLERL